MPAYLVQTTTRDGVRLDGSFQEPPTTTPPPAVAGLCFLHGTGGNFYSSTLFDDLAERFLTMGIAVLRVNTRGHDGISTAVTGKGGRRLGAAYEVVDECRHDVAAWLDWLRQRRGPNVGLVGHSMGAVKALYALAHEPQPGAARVVAISPPCLSYSRFCVGPQGHDFLETYALAESHVREGRPAALLDVRTPLAYVISAAGYLEKYSPDERYNYLRFLAGVPCPVLVTLGGKEVESHPAFQVAEELAALAARHGRVRVETVAGADHFYTGVRAELLGRVERWLGE